MLGRGYRWQTRVVNPSSAVQHLQAAERLFEPTRPEPIISDCERERLARYSNRDRFVPSGG